MCWLFYVLYIIFSTIAFPYTQEINTSGIISHWGEKFGKGAAEKEDGEKKVFFKYTLLMSWREIYIAWWLRILGNYLRAPQGLICDEYRSGDNANQSILVSGGQREQQLPWFNMSYLLTYSAARDHRWLYE